MSTPQPQLGIPTSQLTDPRAVGMQAPLPGDPSNLQPQQKPKLDDTGKPVVKTLVQLPAESSKHPNIDVQQDFDEPVSPAFEPLLRAAHRYLGTSYLHGGADPRKGFDMVRFVQYVHAINGEVVPKTALAQSNAGQVMHDPNELGPGDLVFLSEPETQHKISDQGFQLTGGQFMHSPKGDAIIVSQWADPYYAVRFLKGTRIRTAQAQGSPSVPPAGNSANYTARNEGVNAPSNPAANIQPGAQLPDVRAQ